jgi:hypothetical protein
VPWRSAPTWTSTTWRSRGGRPEAMATRASAQVGWATASSSSSDCRAAASARSTAAPSSGGSRADSRHEPSSGVAEAHPALLLRRLAIVGGRPRPHVVPQGAGELGHRGLSGQGGHLGVGPRRGVAAEDGHLVLGQFARFERLSGGGQLAQPAGHRQQPPGSGGRDSALPRHPLLGRANARSLVGPGLLDPGDQLDEPGRGGVENAAHFGDLIFQLRRLRLTLLGPARHAPIVSNRHSITQWNIRNQESQL